MRIPYIIVVGDKEEKDNTIAIREKGNSKIRASKIDMLHRRIKQGN